MKNQIGKTIKQLRKEHNLTQEKLAEKLNVSAQAVSKWENGSNMPDITLLVDIADCFNITVDELLKGVKASSEINIHRYVHSPEFQSLSDDEKLGYLWDFQRKHPGNTVVASLLGSVVNIPKEKKLPLMYYACDGILRHDDSQGRRNHVIHCISTVYDDEEFMKYLKRLAPYNYNETQGEWYETRRWIVGDIESGRMQRYKNNALIISHFLFRQSHPRDVPELDIEWNLEKIKIIENLGDGGNVPDAWLPYYTHAFLMLKDDYVKLGEIERAYEALDRVLDIYESRISKFKVGDILSLGKKVLFGDITMTVMPGYAEDKAAVFTQKDERFNFDRVSWMAISSPARVCSKLYKSMLEWVKSGIVPDDEKYRKYLERVKALKG